MRKEFWGIYAPYIKQYITFKRELGFKYVTEEYIYYVFDRFTIARGETIIGITKDLANEWTRENPNESNSYRCHKAVCLNQLASFLCKMEIPSYITQVPAYRSTFTPYIYSKSEITAIFKACDDIRGKQAQKSIIIILPALIRLLYGTGLRIGEALSLRVKDVNLDDRYLVIRDSKNGKERMVPISDSLSDVCKEYAKYRGLLPVDLSVNDYFFVSLSGRVCKRRVIGKWFEEILWKAGIPRNDQGPRIHDIRYPNFNNIQTFTCK